jgi:hypothetical protein
MTAGFERWRAELTVFEKSGGPLTKHIGLSPDGSVKSDGSACLMASGVAQRLRLADIGELAAAIAKARSDQAIALGALRAGLPDRVHIVTKSKLNGQPNTIARTAGDIYFRKGKSAYALIDFDTKGMPPEIAERMQQLGGFWPSLLSILPPLESVAHLIRRSTPRPIPYRYRPASGRVRWTTRLYPSHRRHRCRALRARLARSMLAVRARLC